MKALKKISDIFVSLLTIVVALCAIAILLLRTLGYSPYMVLSGSMEPAYPTGSLILVEKAKANEVSIGDPITFVLNEDLVVATHRVIAIDNVNKEFTTKGDANELPDGTPVNFKNLIGIPRVSIPRLGYAVNFITTKPGSYLAIAGLGVLVLFAFVPGLFVPDKKKEDSQEQNQ